MCILLKYLGPTLTTTWKYSEVKVKHQDFQINGPGRHQGVPQIYNTMKKKYSFVCETQEGATSILEKCNIILKILTDIIFEYGIHHQPLLSLHLQ